jgi:hypothetical protein
VTEAEIPNIVASHYFHHFRTVLIMALNDLAKIVASEFDIPTTMVRQILLSYDKLLARQLQDSGKVKVAHVGVLELDQGLTTWGTPKFIGTYRPARDLKTSVLSKSAKSAKATKTAKTATRTAAKGKKTAKGKRS